MPQNLRRYLQDNTARTSTNVDEVRSSIAKKLGIENVKYTAQRDIQNLVSKGILLEDIPGAKRPSYSIIYDPEDLSIYFSNVEVIEVNGHFILKALFKGIQEVEERILPLDAERYQKGDFIL